jgi:hypothetical protein
MSKSGVYLSHPVYHIIWLSLNATFFECKIDLNCFSEYVGGGALKSLSVLSEEYINHYIFIICRVIKAYCKTFAKKILEYLKALWIDVLF